MSVAATFLRGLQNGLGTTWTLARAVAPAYLVVTALKHTAVLPWLTEGLTPAMAWLGLPGQATIPLVMGNLISLYAGIGALASLDMATREVTAVAVMLGFSHNLPMETAITRSLGVRSAAVVALRLGLAVVAALVLRLLGGA